MPDANESRPAANGAADDRADELKSQTSLEDPTDPERDPARCAVCGYVIRSRESIAAGIGRDCRRRLKAAHRAPAPAVTAMGPAAGVGIQSGGPA